MVAVLVPWFETQKGLVGLCETPQGFFRLASVTTASPAMSETRLVWTSFASSACSTPLDSAPTAADVTKKAFENAFLISRALPRKSGRIQSARTYSFVPQSRSAAGNRARRRPHTRAIASSPMTQVSPAGRTLGAQLTPTTRELAIYSMSDRAASHPHQRRRPRPRRPADDPLARSSARPIRPGERCAPPPIGDPDRPLRNT